LERANASSALPANKSSTEIVAAIFARSASVAGSAEDHTQDGEIRFEIR
jgi:hypothetical protein